MPKFAALLQFLLALGGCAMAAPPTPNRISQDGYDVLASEARLQDGVARFDCEASDSGWCHYTLYADTLRCRQRLHAQAPLRRFSVACGDSRQIAGLDGFRAWGSTPARSARTASRHGTSPRPEPGAATARRYHRRMNYLAHAWLARHSDDALLGGCWATSCSGNRRCRTGRNRSARRSSATAASTVTPTTIRRWSRHARASARCAVTPASCSTCISTIAWRATGGIGTMRRWQRSPRGSTASCANATPPCRWLQAVLRMAAHDWLGS